MTRRMLTKTLTRVGAATALVLLSAPMLTGCATSKNKADTQYVARDVSTLYNSGKSRLDRGQYKLAAALFEPGCVHAVTGAKNIAAGNAFVRLHQIKLFPRQGALDAAGKTPVATEAPQMLRSTLDNGMFLLAAGPFARDQRQGQRALALGEGIERRGDKAFGTAKRVIALAHQRKADSHRPVSASSSCTAR